MNDFHFYRFGKTG
ncbi:hypothetical protein EO213_18325 [Paracoccus denitrificans]|nr:hypothetical protein EO213_18325 [Paracoccus denitrificans]